MRSQATLVTIVFHRLLLCIIAGVVLLPGGQCTAPSGSMEGDGVNLFGSAHRSSDYAAFVDAFRTGFFIPHKLEASESYRVQAGQGMVQPPLPVGRSVYLVRADGTILKVEDDQIIWQHRFPERIAVPLVADGSGRVYGITAQGTVFALDADGTVRWRYSLQSPEQAGWYGVPLIWKTRLVVHSYGGTIVALSLKGNPVWEHHFAPGLLPLAAADSTGNVYAVITARQYGATDTVVCVDTAGVIRWKTPLSRTRALKMVAASNRNVYVAGVSVDGKNRIPRLWVVAAAEGAVKDSVPLPATPRGFAVSGDSLLVVAGYESRLGKVYSIVAAYQGTTLRWKRSIEGKVDIPPLLARDNIAVITHFDLHSAVVVFDRTTGKILEYASLDELPLLHLLPMVGDNGNMLLAMREKNGWVEIGEPAIYRILPY